MIGMNVGQYFSRALLLLSLIHLPFLFLFFAAPSAATEPILETLPQCFLHEPKDLPLLQKECGFLIVSENQDRPDGAQIKIGYLRLSSTAAKPSTPIFMLAGGPGQTLIDPNTLLLFSEQFLGPLLKEHDVVILDQRGAPRSKPVLDCPKMNNLPWLNYKLGLNQREADKMGWRKLAECVADAEKANIDLSQYNSVRIAADIDAVRQAFGYSKIIYYGASYGAQLGQHFMRDFPGSLEAVVLDGTNSLLRKSWIEDRVQDVDSATDKLAALCASDAKCSKAYDVRKLLRQAMDLFADGPINTTFKDPNDPKTQIELTLTESDLAPLVFEFQTGQNAIRSLPALLTAIVEKGRTSAAAVLGDIKGTAILASRDQRESSMAILMHFAVVCSDDPVLNPEELNIGPAASAYAVAYGKSILEMYLEGCRAVRVPPLPDSTDLEVTTDIPTLILAGNLDARTPVNRSEVVAKALPKATIVEFPEGTHVQLGEVNLCAGQILIAFLANPNSVPKTDCIAKMPRRGFILPDGTMTTD